MVGQRLRDLREDADLSQEKFGKTISVGNHSISAFERNIREPNDEIKIKIARYFKVSIDYLVGLADDPKPMWDNTNSYLRLPMNFPPQAKKEAEEYIRFLTQKYKGASQSTK